MGNPVSINMGWSPLIFVSCDFDGMSSQDCDTFNATTTSCTLPPDHYMFVFCCAVCVDKIRCKASGVLPRMGGETLDAVQCRFNMAAKGLFASRVRRATAPSSSASQTVACEHPQEHKAHSGNAPHGMCSHIFRSQSSICSSVCFFFFLIISLII